MNKDLEIQKNCIEMNLVLAQKFMNDGKIELATHRVTDAKKSLEKLFEDIKKAN